MSPTDVAGSLSPPWNRGIIVGQKRPLMPQQVWSIRARLELGPTIRDLVLFNLAIDSKLRACDLVRMRLEDICAGGRVRAVQLLLVHTKLESTVRYLGVEVDDVLHIVEQIEL